ncbi:hypothetical protein G7A66_07485 [Altererythrobacter sp. SALINAS58]|uniref:hypothetical protein n=1 Tax=Alteripontixanthobacter muriae TaxID=2705546 RepID=UPI00157716E1|nr:hypothetical protein [Alteripontixanthobacter muriae]NTZ42929.1 hypothetical protein [Alteripontixanthobacter muriae]
MIERTSMLLRRLIGVPAVLAAASMASSPAIAAPLPAGLPQSGIAHIGSFDGEATDMHNYRRGRYGNYRHRRSGTDLGDILTGVLVIGGIAAVASAATSASRNDRYRYRDARYPQQPYRYRVRGDNSWRDGGGIDRSVDLCIREVEQEVRVAAVDTVDRTSEGWRISGTLYDGSAFSCSIDRSGRVDEISYGVAASGAYVLPSDDVYGSDGRGDYTEAAVVDDRQHNADIYRQARLRVDGAAPVIDSAAEESFPAYPGGPLPGEDFGDEYQREDDPFRER